MSKVEQGCRVQARTADNTWVTLRAATAVEPGQDFPIVWLLEEDRWKRALEERADARREALPWPAEDVERLEEGE